MDDKGQGKYGTTVDADPARRFEVEIGDTKQAAFFPRSKILGWDNEINLSFGIVDANPTGGVVTADASKVTWERAGRTVRIYAKPVADDPKDMEIEYEIELAEKPDSNVIELSIETKGLDFFFQPPLTEEFFVGQIIDGYTVGFVSETEVLDDKGRRRVNRPENIVRSWAAYHSTRKGNIVGGKSYRHGKAFHIPRPWAKDAAGKQVWCDLDIDVGGGKMPLTIPQKFLDEAAYPVIVDPSTFGYTTHGGTGASVADPSLTVFTPSESGTVTSMTLWCKQYFGGGCNGRFSIYDYVVAVPVNLLASSGSDVAISASTEYSKAVSWAFSGGTPLWLGMWTDTINADVAYDVGATHQSSAHGSGYTYPTWPATWVEVFALARVYSIYATYNPAAINTGNFFALF